MAYGNFEFFTYISEDQRVDVAHGHRRKERERVRDEERRAH